eukprot:Gb_07470 [translate_table: standard]
MFCYSEGDSLMVEQRPLAQHHCIMDLGSRDVQIPASISAGDCASPPRLHQIYPNGNGNGAGNGVGNGVVVVVHQDEVNPNINNANTHPNPPNPTEMTKPEKIVRHKECQRNHAANIGGHALDGCGEFMPSAEDALKCAACSCHRNFHRREVEGEQPCDFCRKDRKRGSSSGPGSPVPYYPVPHGSSAPHMLMALSSGLAESDDQDGNMNHHHRGMKKRFRTKFSQDQKEKMYIFADKMGWRMQKQDEAVVQQFCNEIGVGKGVLKVWMHNNKHTLAAWDFSSSLMKSRKFSVEFSAKLVVRKLGLIVKYLFLLLS